MLNSWAELAGHALPDGELMVVRCVACLSCTCFRFRKLWMTPGGTSPSASLSTGLPVWPLIQQQQREARCHSRTPGPVRGVWLQSRGSCISDRCAILGQGEEAMMGPVGVLAT
jgi:hypothetical protein